MAKSKNKKDHKKRSQARTQKLKESKNRAQKIQTEMIRRMIEQEKQKGMFNNLPTIDPVGGDINLDGPMI